MIVDDSPSVWIFLSEKVVLPNGKFRRGEERKGVVMVDGFWMKENGKGVKGVKGLEGIGLMEVETWEIKDL